MFSSKMFTREGKPRHIMYTATDPFVNGMSGIMRYPENHRDYIAEGMTMQVLHKGRKMGYRPKEDKLYDTPTTKAELYDFTLNQIVWIEDPIPFILESGKYIYLYPMFSKYKMDIRASNLKRLLREAYAREVTALKSHLTGKKVHLLVDFHRKMSTSYIGLTITVKNSKPKMLGLIDFDDKSPEAQTWMKRITEILQEFELAKADRFKSVTFYSHYDEGGEAGFHNLLMPNNLRGKSLDKRSDKIGKRFAQTFEALKLGVGELLGGHDGQSAVPEETTHNSALRDLVDHKMGLGIKYRDDCMCDLIQATKLGQDDYIPECTKEILFFRTNDVMEYGYH
eukprot:TRINITY_DN5180_c0_g1_i2.p1 TRINITY_DN5180_c0_g1~~TRINITY_DN5180_c0_g1_i2.p1  ORF type:complete len:338 (+),score=86.41 TRINITY_DN5180_c0_g1_i2:188-1201(+)